MSRLFVNLVLSRLKKGDTSLQESNLPLDQDAIDAIPDAVGDNKARQMTTGGHLSS